MTDGRESIYVSYDTYNDMKDSGCIKESIVIKPVNKQNYKKGTRLIPTDDPRKIGSKVI